MNNSKTGNSVSLSNRFTPLSDNEEDEVVEVIETNKKKPPPLVLHGRINDHKKFINMLNKISNGEYHLVYLHEGTQIHFKTTEVYDKVKRRWIEENVCFHTYTGKNDKRHTYVIKGLHGDIDATDISEELRSKSIDVINVNKMKGTIRPMYMVSIRGETKLSTLTNVAKYICYTRVTWERYVSKRKATQCHRCQKWGHATSNCYGDPKCLKCAESHLTKDCKKPQTTPAKCANCEGSHPANYTSCSAYLKRMEKTAGKKKTTEQRPPPLEKRVHPPSINDMASYPPMLQPTPTPKPTTRTATAWGKPPADRPPQTSYTHQLTRPTGTGVKNTDISDFLELINEINNLKKEINLTKMLAAVKGLSAQIKSCQTQIEKFEAFTQFCQALDEP
jgi:hypothetical protein